MKQFELLISEFGQRESEAVYTHLLKGETLPVNYFAELLNLNAAEAQKALASYGEVGAQGRVVGFVGLSLVPTQHRLIVQDRTLYAWCAADAILLPQILYFSALIESKDPVNGQVIHLSVNEDFLEWIDPVPLSVSWVEEAVAAISVTAFASSPIFLQVRKPLQRNLPEIFSRFGKGKMVTLHRS